jgi:hypothetical protein
VRCHRAPLSLGLSFSQAQEEPGRAWKVSAWAPSEEDRWDSGLAIHRSECLERCHVLRIDPNSMPESGHYATEPLRMNKDHCSWNPWIKRSSSKQASFQSSNEWPIWSLTVPLHQCPASIASRSAS